MPRYAVLLAYDGTAFAGWWRQPDTRTVGGVLDAAFARLGEPTAHALGASRTDAGVHAREQVAHVDCARPWRADDLARALSSQLPPDVACRAVAAVAEDWHAVHHASSKTYRYRLDVGAVVDPFLAPRISWRPPFTPALPALQAALQVVAVWMHWAGRSPGDWLLPTGPMPPSLAAQRLYDGASFLAALQDPAQQQLAASKRH